MATLRTLTGPLLLIFALFAIARPTSAQAPTGVLAGAVTDESGRAVPGVTLRLEGPARRTSVSDASGIYRFVGLSEGRYTLRIESLGYAGNSHEVDVARGTSTLDLTVQTAPLALAPLQVVTATRAGKMPATLPIKIDVIEQREVQLQRAFASNPTEMLSNLIPSYSPSRQKLTSAGESFRGRRPLFLIDGVPQSNPLRDGRRDGFTIGSEVIERVEVLFGANAIQGLGATGGIVNYITVRPPESGALEQRLSVATSAGDALDGESFGWRGHYQMGKRLGDFEVLAAASFERRGLQFDAENRAIGLDNVQGDIADSGSRNFFGKLGWTPAPHQRLHLMISDFRLEQRGSFEGVEGDREVGMPAVSIPGNPEGVEPINDVTTAALDYEHTAVAGGTLSAKVYVQDFAALYGGGRFGTFQDPAIAPVGTHFDQSENNSQKFGTRLTFARSDVGGTPVDLVSGIDVLRDETFQRLVHSDRKWVPATRFWNYAPFAQLDLRLTDALALSGGLRWELAQLDVSTFSTLAGNREDFRTITVEGGRPAFDEPLFNFGAVVTPVEGFRLYGSIAQAFTMPDVGRVLRGISVEGAAVEGFLDLEPVETDNVEVGAAYGTEFARVGATYFRSDASFGSRLVPNEDGIFQVRRQPTRTSGWEFTGLWVPTRRMSINAGYSVLHGRFDGDDDGIFEADLSASDIGPDRFNFSVDAELSPTFSSRVQLFHFFDRRFTDAVGAETAYFDGYTTADVSLVARLGGSTATLAASNVLDTQYITYYGQAATTLNSRYFAGRGRTLTLRVDTRF